MPFLFQKRSPLLPQYKKDCSSNENSHILNLDPKIKTNINTYNLIKNSLSEFSIDHYLNDQSIDLPLAHKENQLGHTSFLIKHTKHRKPTLEENDRGCCPNKSDKMTELYCSENLKTKNVKNQQQSLSFMDKNKVVYGENVSTESITTELSNIPIFQKRIESGSIVIPGTAKAKEKLDMNRAVINTYGLTNEDKKLFLEACKVVNRLGYKFIWVKRNKIMVRRTIGSRELCIHTMEDLNNLETQD